MADPVSVTTHINAPPEVVYGLVSDLPRMREWSPENTGGTWLGGASAAATGARFRGTNRNESKRWSTTATVIDATPGESFAFDVTVGPIKVARWSYRIEPSATGCEVTESWEDRRGALAKRLGGIASGVTDRRSYVEGNMRTTLENLKAAAEA